MAVLIAGSSKTAPRIEIFSMAMGANYSFELMSIETYAPQFNGHNKLFLGSMYRHVMPGHLKLSAIGWAGNTFLLYCREKFLNLRCLFCIAAAFQAKV